jgi:hypothetical protein
MAKLGWPNSVLHCGGTTAELFTEAVHGLVRRYGNLAGLIAITAHFETETTTTVARYTECFAMVVLQFQCLPNGPR